MRKALIPLAVLALVAATALPAQARDYGKVQLVGKGLAMELEFKGGQKLVLTSKTKKLPVGTYTPESYTLMMQGKGGTYRLTSVTATDGTGWSLTVEKDQTTEVDLGPPLKVVPIRYAGGRDKTGQLVIPIGFSIQGKNGETYEHGVRMGAMRVPAPVFQIESEDGKALATGKFEYG
ncbi:MAG TPA: hypothetical protein VMX57_00825 [Planctomycetota bacterium]|nr:hypothetical protein [Planctomycetota bacterium]